MSFDSDLARWQSITTDAKEQQHADAIAIDEAVDKRAERVRLETAHGFVVVTTDGFCESIVKVCRSAAAAVTVCDDLNDKADAPNFLAFVRVR